MPSKVKPMAVVDSWSKLKKAIVKDPNVKQNRELSDCYKALFKTFDQGLTKKAKATEKKFAAATSKGNIDPRQKQMLTKEIDVVVKLTDNYLKQVNVVKKGFDKKFPQAGGGFSFLSKQLLTMKKHMEQRKKELKSA